MTSFVFLRHSVRYLVLAGAAAGVMASSAHAAPGGPRGGMAPGYGAPPQSESYAYPVAEGTVQRFLTTAYGEANALLTSDGRVVAFAPHMATSVLAALPVGSTVRVFGRVAPYGQIHASSLVNVGTGATVVDQPPVNSVPSYGSLPLLPRHLAAQALVPLQAAGTITVLLTGPVGDVRGVLLDTGAVVYLPRHAAYASGLILQVGAPFAAAGLGTANALGTAIEALRVGTGSGNLQPLYMGI